MDARARRTALLATLALATLVLSAGALLLSSPPLTPLQYVVSAALFLAALFFGSGAYAVWTGQIGMDEPERDRED